jgi:hypothetical protein
VKTGLFPGRDGSVVLPFLVKQKDGHAMQRAGVVGFFGQKLPGNQPVQANHA